jgi:hypothetical protein
MALASYNDLKAAVADHIHRADLTTPIPDLITLAEKRINREVRAPEMQTAYSGTISSGVIAVPTDFLEWKAVYVSSNGAHMLQPKALEWVWTHYPTRTADGIPIFIARNGTNFEFGPYPDSNYAVVGSYFKRMGATSSAWHALATASPDLYLFGALSFAAAYVDDPAQIQKWDAMYRDIRESINGEAKGQEISGGPIRMTAR